MSDKMRNKLLFVASSASAIAGLSLLVLSIFGETQDNWILSFALMSLLFSNLFNLIRIQTNRKDAKKDNDSREEGEKRHE